LGDFRGCGGVFDLAGTAFGSDVDGDAVEDVGRGSEFADDLGGSADGF